MQRRQDLWRELTTEVRLQDMVNKKPGARADKPEAQRIAQIVAKENDDRVLNQLPSPLVAQPADLLAFMLGQLPAAELAKSATYPVVRGGAWVTAQGRIIIVEFKDPINEAAPPVMRNSQGAGVAPITVGAAPTGAPKMGGNTTAPISMKPSHPNSYGPSDEGSHATITVLARHRNLYQMDWMPDEDLRGMGSHAAFHVFSEDNEQQWTPMTLQLYIQLAEQVKAARAGQVGVVNKLNGLPSEKLARPKAAPKPAMPRAQPAKPGEEPQMRDDLGLTKPRKKFLGVF